MSENVTRRSVLKNLAGIVGGILAMPAGARLQGGRAKRSGLLPRPRGLRSVPTQMAHGPGRGPVHRLRHVRGSLQARRTACPEGHFRTWIERYVITKPKPGSGETRGETVVDSPDGGIEGFPEALVPKEDILKSFFVPKLCNLCEHSPCTQVCPVGATFEAPDGAVLVDKNYCIGCGFCIQACPYGCRFFNPETHTADKCTLCYHRITRGLKPACVEICPSQARIFGDLKNPVPDDPLQQFIANNKVEGLKRNLGTGPRVAYAGLDEEVR